MRILGNAKARLWLAALINACTFFKSSLSRVCLLHFPEMLTLSNFLSAPVWSCGRRHSASVDAYSAPMRCL
ncbi:hypothetical protein F4806DRAFT_322274 [Annulohypoxylon nitens]|nr:hypothetical protein F4806DRAFT_322274 [Annulohypoxylon nitens]